MPLNAVYLTYRNKELRRKNMNNTQKSTFNKLVKNADSELREVTRSKLSEKGEGDYKTVVFNITTNFKIASGYLSEKTVIGMIGPRGKVTIWS